MTTITPPAASTVEIKVPGLGESITEATIAKWVKNEGDVISSEDVIAELETDKATVELSPVQTGLSSGKKGTLRLKAAKGETVAIGQVIAVFEIGAVAATPVAAPAPTPNTTAASPANTNPTLSPAVRALIEEKKLDPTKIPATGKDGRLTKEDVVNYVETTGPTQGSDSAAANQSRESRGQQTQPGMTAPGTTTVANRDKATANASTPPKATADDESREPMSNLRRTIARRLVDAQHDAAILTTFNEVDMTAVMALRTKYKEQFEKQHKIGLGFMSFFAKAAVSALKAVPAVNAQIDGNDVVYKKSVHLGVAVSTPRGLVVPVVRNAQNMTMAQIEGDIIRLATKARENKISIEDMTGGTFTITNGGVFGSLLSTPIINPPQSAILGMHKIEKRAVVIDDQIVARPMMYLALSYDHRLIDGQQAVTFLVKIKEALEDPARMLLEI